MTKRKTHEEFVQEVKEKYGNEYEILGKYVNTMTKIKVKHNCDKCNFHEWEITPDSLLHNHGCPVCSNQKVVLGINTIWDTDRWMVDLGVSEEDAKRYSHSSSKTITVKCSDCGKKKQIKLQDVYRYQSICCPCGDGKSYPEKFVMNVLEQLDVDFETEYKFGWSNDKRYDFYIKYNNYIIEVHGKQHYSEGFSRVGGRTLKQERINDKYKRELALSNGIKHYIELDCRESNIEWIKNSILNSKLAKLFDLSNIDWLQCAEFANKNIVKEVCDYWNNRNKDETTTDLGKELKMNRCTIREYLKKGSKLGWCDYSSEEQSFKNRSRIGKSKGKKIKVIKDNKSLGIFPSCTELSRQSEELFGVKFLIGSISRVCLGKRKQYKGFTFKYVEEGNNLNISKIA